MSKETEPSIASGMASAEQLDIKLPTPPEPFGAYVEAVQTGNLLFLSGMLPTEGHAAKFIGRVGAELDVEAGRQAAHLAALNGLAVARQHLGSLDRVTQIVRLGVSVATAAMSAIIRRSLTALRSYCKTCSEKTRTRAAWCMASQACRSAARWSWKSFSKWRSSVRLPLSVQGKERPMTHPTFYRTIQIDGLSIFYREAGSQDAPTLLLLHGLPSSSRMFEPLFARLSDQYHLVAPDYPGFGHSDWPDPKQFAYTFDHYAEMMTHFTEALGLARYTLYMQDYGGPVGFRMALAHPDASRR